MPVNLTWEEKLQAMRSVDSDCCVHMVKPGDWICNLPGMIGGEVENALISDFGAGVEPRIAVADAWYKIENLEAGRYIVKDKRHLRWNGFMFADV